MAEVKLDVVVSGDSVSPDSVWNAFGSVCESHGWLLNGVMKDYADDLCVYDNQGEGYTSSACTAAGEHVPGCRYYEPIPGVIADADSR